MSARGVVEVAVATRRLPKLNAVWEALSVIGPLLAPEARFEVVAVEAPGIVRHTPLSRQETMRGAGGRAEWLRQKAQREGLAWQYFVGLEGGVDLCEVNARRWAFLHNWACVLDRQGEQGWGHSGGILLPERVLGQVLEEQRELAEVIDELAGAQNVRDAQGAWGVLSANLITRQDAFRLAVISAFAPFYNRALYAGAGARSTHRGG